MLVLTYPTHTPHIGYNKSYTKNFLEHTRVNIRDRSLYEYVKGDFPPIISEEKWNRVQAIKSRKVTYFDKKTRGKPMAKDKWVKHLFCECGSTYKRYKWRTNKTGEECYGYQCRNQVNHRKRSFHIKNGLDGEGYCDVPSICEWKLDFMAKAILSRLWKNQECQMEQLTQTVEQNYTEEKEVDSNQYEIARLNREKERLSKRKENLMDMVLDNLVDKDEYQRRYSTISERMEEIEQNLTALQEDKAEKQPVNIEVELEKIKEFLDKACDLGQKQISEELVNALINRVIPTEDGVFKWYIQSEDYDLEIKFNEEDYVLCNKFSLGFEEAKKYRKKFGNFIRANQWRDIVVEVYIKNPNDRNEKCTEE